MKRRTPAEFKDSLSLAEPPEDFSVYEKALWYAGKGNWEQAHTLVQDMHDRRAAQIHGFVHRHEGDLSNAQYWYDRAGSPMPAVSLEEEWELLVAENMG